MTVIERKKRSKSNVNGGIIRVLAKYEDAFSWDLLQEITELYHEGYCVEDIAETFNRPVMEIIMALLHQADEKKITRAFAHRRNQNE
ncbi:hypothetical protein GMD78_12170 [Ornithinibacillus sp. L9]|uniref:Uncharacterized protein n=1 Tax=Ornithinibacillus caprae TaxID=2678566 RepID=A0A6N8FMZ4_9BACI|nr:hypothetical protein [Ornithinibacillus caprae]MUK89129.1 hypothetical protein [Ornithinibacillus caprae]